MNKNKKKALLVSIAVSLVLLIIAVAATLIYDHYMEYIEFNTVGMVVGHIIGFCVMVLIIYKYETHDDNMEQNSKANDIENHNIY